MKRALILGGTGDALKLAASAAQISGIEVITSLAGRTQSPLAPVGSVRSGGFGGAVGLSHYLRDCHIDLLIDATHPFAAQISWNAAKAADEVGILRLMLVRPAWQKNVGDHWIEVETHEAAAATLPDLSQRVFLTIGRQELATFADLENTWFLMRMIDPPALNTSIPRGLLLLERGPFSLDHEQVLLSRYGIGAVVSKNSGGTATYAKIRAAREVNLPVVMIQRPALPEGEKVQDVKGAIAWIHTAINHA